MAIGGDTGNGTTLTFGTSSLSLLITQITVGEETIDMLDASTLATTDYQTMIRSDLKKTPEVTFQAIFVQTANAPTVGAAPETVTVTYPTLGGTAANIAGTAVITGRTFPAAANGQIMMLQGKIKYDGDTGPAYTKES